MNPQHVSSAFWQFVAMTASPMLTTFILDEECLRYYLNFTTDLKDLMGQVTD